MEYLDLVFEQYQVSDITYIRVTRNADISPDDENYADNEDFRYIMKETLNKRRRMAVVRLEVANPLNKETEKYLCEKFKITPACIFRTKIPMKLDYIFSIMDKVPVSMKRHWLMYHCSTACRTGGRRKRDGSGKETGHSSVLSI